VFLFIGESIGWQELFLIGVLALIFLGPRKLPQIAKTIGKTLAELKSAGQEFRNTWEREVSLEEEEKNFLKNPFDENLILAEDKYREPAPRDENNYSQNGDVVNNGKSLPMPEVKEVSYTDFHRPNEKTDPTLISPTAAAEQPAAAATTTANAADTAGKQDWL
jgi:Tat protein translocase TatB subunit